ncbi:putative beta-glucosidase I [Venturia nashicola]|nr:putative beta-glucosidase I [Venturia nashicola]
MDFMDSMDAETSQEQAINLDHLQNLIKSPATDAFTFNQREQQILELWDQEEEVRLELNLLNSQAGRQEIDISSLSDQEVQAEIKKTECELLEARSKYTLKNRIIQNVIITEPVLKAVHSGEDATELEKRLLPLIIERDTLSMVHSVLSTKLQNANARLSSLERENIQAIAENKELAREMLEIANELKTEKVEEIEDARLRKQLERLEEEVKKARIEWRTMKSLVAGIVAGSGVNWADDPKLLSLVLDEEDELG